jgi:hypothetical protein
MVKIPQMFKKSELREDHVSLGFTLVAALVVVVVVVVVLPVLAFVALMLLPLLLSMALHMKLLIVLLILFTLYKTAAMFLHHRRLMRKHDMDILNADVSKIGDDEAERRAEKYRGM